MAAEAGNPPKCRVLDALSDEEERHAILAQVHLALARGWREQELEKLKGREDEARAVREDSDSLQEELRQTLATCDDKVLADMDALELAVLLPKVQDDSVVMLRALQTLGWGAFEYAGPELLADRETMLKAVGLHGEVLRFASESLQDNKQVVLAAIRSCPWSLDYASDNLKADREVVLAAIARQDPADTTLQGDSVLTLAAPELRDDKEIVLAAIARKPIALNCASVPLKCDRDVVFAALQKQRPHEVTMVEDNLLNCASRALRKDRELVLEAVKAGGAAVCLASSELRQDKDFILAAMRFAPVGTRYHCYREASQSVRRCHFFQEFEDATNSVLAVAGETAPVLTVSPGPPESQSSWRSPSTSTCDVVLLSRASFCCDLLRNESDEPPDLEDPDSDPEFEPPREPALKQRRLADLSRRTSPTYLTVGELARQALEEAKKYMQVVPPPERVFLVFSNRSRRNSSSSELVSATPWDWNRPVTHFL